MRKEEIIKELIINGKTLDEILPPTKGSDDCLIFKASPEEFHHAAYVDVVYIPDYDLNRIQHNDADIIDTDVLMNIADHCYTKGEFLFQAANNEKMAEDLFEITNWQNPDITDLLNEYDNEDFKRDYGVTIDEFLKKDADRYGFNEVNAIYPYDDESNNLEAVFYDGSTAVFKQPEIDETEYPDPDRYFEENWNKIMKDAQIIPAREHLQEKNEHIAHFLERGIMQKEHFDEALDNMNNLTELIDIMSDIGRVKDQLKEFQMSNGNDELEPLIKAALEKITESKRAVSAICDPIQKRNDVLLDKIHENEKYHKNYIHSDFFVREGKYSLLFRLPQPSTGMPETDVWLQKSFITKNKDQYEVRYYDTSVFHFFDPKHSDRKQDISAKTFDEILFHADMLQKYLSRTKAPDESEDIFQGRMV